MNEARGCGVGVGGGGAVHPNISMFNSRLCLAMQAALRQAQFASVKLATMSS